MNYRIVGQDGKIYGPVVAEKIREWLAQGRVDARTAIFVDGAADWTFVGLLPEFSPQATPLTPGSLRRDLAPAQKTNGFATAGFVCGLLSCCGCCCCFPVSFLGVIFSIVAMVQIKSSHPPQNGWGLAVAGLICSILGLLAGIIINLINILTHSANSINSFNWN